MKFITLINKFTLFILVVFTLLVLRSTTKQVNQPTETVDEIEKTEKQVMSLEDDSTKTINQSMVMQYQMEYVKHYVYTPRNINHDTTQEYDLPNLDTSFKAYMDYQTITDTTTKQWELQQMAYTDEYGLRKIDNDYCVAIGTYYSDTVGERFEITLANGNVFTVVVSDLKQDEHTNETHMYTPVIDEYGNFHSANVLEFIVDENSLSSIVQVLGTVDGYEYFSGNIESIEKINN